MFGARVRVSEPRNRPVTDVVILLHGQSMNGRSMMLKSREQVRELMPGAAIIAPDGPKAADPDQHIRARRSLSGHSRAWFEVPRRRFHPREDLRDQIRPSVDYVHNIIDEAKRRYSLDESRIHIVGFSQGGAIGLQTAIEREETVGSVALLCSPFFDPLIFGMKEPKSRPPIFYGFDLGDEIVPAGLAYHAMTAMKRLGLRVVTHITKAAPAQEVTRYDRFGRPYKAMMPQPGAPRFEKNKTVTGHWVNEGMRRALVETFHQLRQKPDHLIQGPSTRLLSDMVTPRITVQRVALYWMLNPNRPSSQVSAEQRPMTAWNKLVWRNRLRLHDIADTLMQQTIKFVSPLLLDLPEQVAVEVHDRRKLSQLFSSLARGAARVLIPKAVDLPAGMARNLELRTRKKERFIHAGDMPELMGNPEKPSLIKRLFSRKPKP